ncbi:hypothetical protein [Oceanobacillus sp. CFH 90083]|uniref:hypothetical protein n=1 Tax=Oceanobacillus sp. CFH 90083 TaxID=2592336 RepID=UPI0018844CAE|nr:hypothetical protein [Oceanobacillus sp. CFH 90083]
MKIISFQKEHGVAVDSTTTKFTAHRILHDASDIRMSYKYLEAGDKIPFHEAQAD